MQGRKPNALHLVAVEDQDLASEQATQGLDRLRLAGASRPVRVPPEPHLHGLGQGQVALVSQRGVHQLGRIPLTGGPSGGGGRRQGGEDTDGWRETRLKFSSVRRRESMRRKRLLCVTAMMRLNVF